MPGGPREQTTKVNTNSNLIPLDGGSVSKDWTVPQALWQSVTEEGALPVQNINVLTRAQTRSENSDLQHLEQLDTTSTATPNSLDQYSQHDVVVPDLPEDELPGNPFTEEELLNNSEHLFNLQLQDPTLAKYFKLAQTNKDNYYLNNNNILCKTFIDEFGQAREIIVAPESLRSKIFLVAHKSLLSGHFCLEKTIDIVYKYFTWPNIYKDIQEWCRCCKHCQRYNSPNENKAPLAPLPVVTEPWTVIAFDIVGPFKRTARKNKYLLTCLDLSTRYPEAYPLKSIDTESPIDPMITV